MRCTSFFAVVLSLALPGCVGTRPCDEGLVPDPVLGCLPADGGVEDPADGGDRDGGFDAPMALDGGCTTETFYADMDDDEHGDPEVTMEACTAPPGYVALGDDCDDTSELRYPGLTEVCDGLDNDCSDTIDDTFECVQNDATSCMTSCGSTGTGSCSATCTAPAAADCTPPAETCNTVDDDCDGQIDEGLQAVGPALNLGSTTGRVVNVSTPTGHVVFMARSTGIFARRFDASGTVVGSDVTVTTTETNVFDAWSTGSQIVVGWLSGTSILASVFSADLGTISPSAVTVAAGVDDYTAVLRIVAAAGRAIFVYVNSGLTPFGTRCAFPALTGCGAFTVATGYRVSAGQLAMTADGPGGTAYLTYRASTTSAPTVFQAYVDSIALASGSAVRLTTVGMGNNPYNPVPHFGAGPAGEPRLGIVWNEDPTGTASDRLRFALFDATGGTLTIRETLTLSGPYLPPIGTDALAVATSGGRWFVASLTAGSGSTSTVRATEVIEPLVGALTFNVFPLAVSPANENRSVSISGGEGASVLASASRTDGMGRAYLIGCP